jgi:hypothetical protein
MWQAIALWIVLGICLLTAGYGVAAAAIPRLRPMLRREGQVRWPAFVCLMMSCVFIGFPLMVLGPWMERQNVTWIIWAYFFASLVVIGFAMWRYRIGRSIV